MAISPQWNRSWVKEGSGIVKVPLKNSQFADSIYWDVLFQKKNETIHALLIQVKVAPEYLAGKIKNPGSGSLHIRDYVGNNDFTGDVYLYDLDGRFQMGRRFSEGKISYHLHPLSSFKNLEARGRDIVSKMAPIENPYDVPDAGGDVPIGSGGGSNSDPSYTSTQPNFRLSTEIQAQYPRFTQMIKDLPAIVASDPTIMDALNYHTNLTESQIREHLTFGQGPEIKISDGILFRSYHQQD